MKVEMRRCGGIGESGHWGDGGAGTRRAGDKGSRWARERRGQRWCPQGDSIIHVIHAPLNALRWAELIRPFSGRVAAQFGSSIAGGSPGEADDGLKTTGGIMRLVPKDRIAYIYVVLQNSPAVQLSLDCVRPIPTVQRSRGELHLLG